MTSVATVSPADSSPSTASPAPGAPTRTTESFSRMLATTLASFAGAGDPVRNRATQASRTWQTQKQLGRQFTASKHNTALEAAAGAGQVDQSSRADHLRDRHEDDLKGRPSHRARHQADTTDRAMESRRHQRREQRRTEGSSPSPQAGRSETQVTTGQKITEIREQRATQTQNQSSLQTTSHASSAAENGLAPAATKTAVTTNNDGNTGTMQPVGTPVQGNARGIQGANASAPGQQDLKVATNAPARVENAQASMKAAPSSAKSSASPTDFQNILASAGGKKTEADSAKAGTRLQRTATPQTPRGIDITQAKAMQELAGIVRSRINARESSILLRLDPPELGKVQIDLNMKRDVLTLRIETQTQAGHDALQTRLTELRHALEQHGITINRVEVELRPPVTATHDANPAHHHQQQDPAQQNPAQQEQEQAYQQASADGSNQSHDRGLTQGDPENDRPLPTEHDAGLLAGSTNDKEYGELPPLAETGLDLVV